MDGYCLKLLFDPATSSSAVVSAVDAYLLSLLKHNTKHLSSVDIVHYPIFLSNHQYYLKNSLKTNREYDKFFCHLSFAYHPNEISAYLFSEIMLASWNLTKIDYQCPAMRCYLTWLKQTFGK